MRRGGMSAATSTLRRRTMPRSTTHWRAAAEKPGIGGRQAGGGQGVHQLGERLLVVDPAEELPDGEEVLDVVDQRRAGEGHEQRARGEGPDALGEPQHVLRALRGLVLDEVRLVDDHPAEAELAEPADVPVEHLVVDDDDVGEAVDGVAVALDRGGLAAGGPQAGLAHPVRLDDVGHDDEQGIGLRRLGGEQRLGRLAQPRLVGEQEGPVTLRGRGDQPGLVRHELAAAGRRAGRRARAGACTTEAPSPARSNERSSGPRSSQPPAAWAGVRSAARPRSRGPGTGSPSVARRPTAAPRRAWWARRPAPRRARGLLGLGLDARLAQHVALERPGVVGDDGVLAEQRQERRVADGGLRQGGRDVVETLELLGAPCVADVLLRADAGALLAQHQGDGLELRAGGRRDPAAAQGGLGRPRRRGRART